MTAKSAVKLIGRTGQMTVPMSKCRMTVKVKIVDHREMFGREDVQVTPVGGSGSPWVSLDCIAFDGPKVKAAATEHATDTTMEELTGDAESDAMSPMRREDTAPAKKEAA